MDLPAPSHVTLTRQRVNANTCMPGTASLRAFALDAVDLRQAYQAAATIHRSLPPMAGPGYRIMQASMGSRTWIDLAASRDAFAVVGRHSCCDLALDGDPEVALRHLLLRAEPATATATATGQPSGSMLRVLDLQTHLGFCFEQGERESSAVVTGPVALRVGRHAIVAFPSDATEIPAELPPMMVEPVSASPYRHHPTDAPAPSAPRWTHVSLYGPAPSLHEVKGASFAEDAPPTSRAGTTTARIALARQGGGQSVDIADAELETGVLIGRASKCDPRFARLLDDKVSRTHLLILRDRTETAAFDLATTNGTYLDGKRQRRFTLPETGATLSIGLGGARMHWHPPGA
jgi:hypothetical protein